MIMGPKRQETDLGSLPETEPELTDFDGMASVKVEIYGSEYRIRGEADPERIQEIAHYVDSKMREVTHETALGSSLKVAILAALNIAGELFGERDDRNRLLAQVQERAEELTQAIDTELGE
jgi:cell division protein ZapA